MLKVVYLFTVLLIVLLSHLFLLQQLSIIPMVINHATPSLQPIMVNLIVAPPKSSTIAKTTLIASQSMSQSKIKNFPSRLKKNINSPQNSKINKSNQSVKLKIATYKNRVQQPVTKIKITQQLLKSQPIQSVKVKTHYSKKQSLQSIQFKPRLTPSAKVNKSNQPVTKTNVAGKIASAATNNNYSPGEIRVTHSTTPRIQPLISSKKKKSPLTKNRVGNQTIAPVFLGGKPPYPWLSRRHNETGKVLLKVQVNTQGKATVVQIKQSSGSSRLDNAAVNHVQNSAFIPAHQNGNPIMGWKELRFVFQLN